MPKLLWVALPLLIAATLLALQALLRRRAPSRHALNIWSSLLLTGYVSTTAGLGIFWMANQQLPPFDWHYLFGYTTVLLVALHLAFNFPIAWRYLTRPSGTAPAALASDNQHAASARRRWLSTLGLLLTAGTAFVLGMRHGRSDFRVEWPMPGGGSSSADGGPAALADRSAALNLVERYHAFSTHTRVGVLLRAPSVDWGDPPPPFKHYPDAPRVALLRFAPFAPFAPFALAAADSAPFDLQALATVLWHTAAVTDARGPVKLRASPSSGALFSTELYVAARAVAGLPPGLWHYDAKAHALERLAGASPTDAQLGAPSEPALQGAAAVIVATAVFRRTGHKYRDRSYRYVLADLGHALENLRLAAGACGARADLVNRFDEARAAATLGIDEGEEGVLALVALAPMAAQGPATVDAAPSPAAAERPTQTEPRWLLPPAPAGQALPLGVTSAVHLATSLRAAAPPASTSPAAAPPASTADRPAGSFPLPPAAAAASGANLLAIIATRRSVRRFAPTPLSLDALAGVLAGMTAAGSPPLLSAAVRVYVLVNAVAGLAPGAYRYESGPHRLVTRRADTDLRATAQAAAFDQDAIGGAAVVFVLAIKRATFAADASGPARGYRHAFIEAGLVGERIYIEAGARGLGVCAVGAFYDAEAAALLAIDPDHEWVVHFAALGVPSA